MKNRTSPGVDLNRREVGSVVRRWSRASRIVCVALVLSCAVVGRPALAETQVVMLGTGTPIPNFQRAGSGVAVVYNEKAYLFDVGHGVVQRAIEANQRLGITALAPVNIERVFFTHLHSDHTMDYAELASTMWWRRTSQIHVWGPRGLDDMTQGMYAMMRQDVSTRLAGNQPIVNRDYYKVLTTEIEEGLVLEEDGLVIEAFEVSHGDVDQAFGYRVTTPEKTVVISGDTAFSPKLVQAAQGVDILIHEAISEEGLSGLEDVWHAYHSRTHTTTSDLVKVAQATRPKLLVISHVLFYAASVESVLTEVQAVYDGEVVLADDLDVF